MKINFFPDLPIQHYADDRLGFRPFAQQMVQAIYCTQAPFTYGLLGDWGSGKTSILKQIDRFLRDDLSNHPAKISSEQPLCIPIWFNAWDYENEPNLVYPLLYAIKQDFKDRFPDKDFNQTLSNDFRIVLGASLLTVSGAVVKVATKALWGEALDLEAITKQIQAVKDHLPDYENALDTWAEQVEQIKTGYQQFLMRYAQILADHYQCAVSDVRFVLLIDDLDRCLPNTVIGILEAIKNYFCKGPCIYLFALNQKVVYQGIRAKYQDAAVDGREYLEKILNYSFYVPIPDLVCLEAYSTDLLKKLVAGDDLQRHRPYFEIFSQTLRQCLFTNPRKIRRILNHYLFFLQIQEGCLVDFDLPIIVRLIVLAEYFPALFGLLIHQPDPVLAELRQIDQPSFSIQQFEASFGIAIRDQRFQLTLMKDLFAIQEPGAPIRPLIDHIHAVANIIRPQ